MWDVVVVGLGGVGSFALRSLARRKRDILQTKNSHKSLNILGLERFSIGHTHGSSHGKSRIYRHAYFEHEHYVPLLLYSSNEFRLLEQQHESKKRNIIMQCGTLVVDSVKKLGSKTNKEKIVGKDSIRHDASKEQHHHQHQGLVAACHRSANQHNIPVQYMTSLELRKRYPQFIFQDDDIGLLEPGGGFVRPELAVRAALDDAMEGGAKVKENVCVTSIEEVVEGADDNRDSCDNDGGHVILHVEDGDDIMAKKVIVSGGAWMGKLIPEWSSHLHVTRQIQAWIDVGNDASYESYEMPTWIRSSWSDSSSDNDEVAIYGIPADPLSNEPSWIKVAIHGRNDIVDDVDEAIPRPLVTNGEMKELQLAAQDFLRPVADTTRTRKKQHSWLSSSPYPFIEAQSCLYTNSPDGHFIVGQPQMYKRVYGAAGLSGHGFKMTPALGKVLSDLALDGTTSLPIDFLSPKRFGI
mmetsp:Transcript_41587/g.60878  ORF Transcript_41587/g.60878 Transcript_41587/m.60878 type:complete len:466 (-) Transcript_41587:187-1584(-)